VSGLLLAIARLCLITWAILPVAAHESTSPEYRSKASFLANFVNFVDWPSDTFSDPSAPLLICVRGDFSFGTTLAELARGASRHSRRVEVRWVRKDQDLRSCQVAFISRSESKRYSKLLQALNGASVLTVGETAGFLESGGAINLLLEEDALRFEVNLSATDGAHLRVSSQLLTLARRILNRTEAAKG
jgi:YfiR/HmsC-like